MLFGDDCLPNACTTGTDRTLQVAVTNAPHFLSNCVKTHPTGEHPSSTSTLQIDFIIEEIVYLVDSNWNGPVNKPFPFRCCLM